MYTPVNNQLDKWEEEEYVLPTTIDDYRDRYDMDDFRKEETYVFRFSEVARDTVSPVPARATVRYQPPDKEPLIGRVDEVYFTDGALDAINVSPHESAGWYDEDDTVRIPADGFAEHGAVENDPWEQVLGRRPTL